MKGGGWHKNDTTFYAVYYANSYGERELDVVTNDFGGWLKKTNKDRVDEDHPNLVGFDHPNADDVGIKYDADDFWLEDVEVFSRKGR